MVRLKILTVFLCLLFSLSQLFTPVSSNSTVYWEEIILANDDQFLINKNAIYNNNTGNAMTVSSWNTVTWQPGMGYGSSYSNRYIEFSGGIPVNYHTLEFANLHLFFDHRTNDTYVVASDFLVWKYNSSYSLSTNNFATWYNLTNYLTLDIAKDLPSQNERTLYSLAFDIDRGQILLYGGAANTYNLQDTWLFDITSGKWQLIVSPINPGYRESYSLLYIPEKQKYYLFGGWTRIDNTYYNDLWEFDPETQLWSQIITYNTPLPRSKSLIAYHPVYDALVIYGGSIESAAQNEIWIYDFSNSYWVYLINENHGQPYSIYDRLIYFQDEMRIQYYNTFILHMDLDITFPYTSETQTITHDSTETVTQTETINLVETETITTQEIQVVTTTPDPETIISFNNHTVTYDPNLFTEESNFESLGIISLLIIPIIIAIKKKKVE